MILNKYEITGTKIRFDSSHSMLQQAMAGAITNENGV